MQVDAASSSNKKDQELMVTSIFNLNMVADDPMKYEVNSFNTNKNSMASTSSNIMISNKFDMLQSDDPDVVDLRKTYDDSINHTGGSKDSDRVSMSTENATIDKMIKLL